MGAQGPDGIAAGGAVVEILLSGELEAWTNTYLLQVTVVQPTDGVTEEQLGGREWSHVVDLSNMSIVWTEFGSYSDQGEGNSVVAAGIAELKARLAQ